MTTVASNPFNLRVASAVWTPGYTVPSTPGQVLPIGQNKPGSILPSGITLHNWHYALFNYYGGGAFNTEYSQGGAWTVAGSGGHTVPACNQGGVAFDFTDATWKYHAAAHTGVTPRNIDYSPSELVFVSGGSVIAGSSPPCPAPAHQYANISTLSAANGGGPRGSFLRLLGTAIGTDDSGSTQAWSFSFSTNQWTLFSTNQASLASNGPRDCHFDSGGVGNRYYLMPKASSDGALNTITTVGKTWGTNAVISGDATYRLETAYDPVRRILIAVDANTGTARGIDINTATTTWTWTNLTLVNASLLVGGESQWAYCPTNGCFYNYTGFTATNYLVKLTPPTYNGVNKFTGNWTVSRPTLSTTLPAMNPSLIPANAHHHTRLFYVPSLQVLCWIPGYPEDLTSNQVFLICPP